MLLWRNMYVGFFELLSLAVGLSMDAFAVSICKGLSVSKVCPKHMLICGLYFGGFQALMPLISYLLGVNFRSMIASVDHWIAFVLLSLIGANMLRESFSKDKDENLDASFGVKTMLLMAVATSIDALAVGVTFAFLEVNIVPAVSFIGITTFIFSAAGVLIGNIFGTKWKNKAEFAGGAILILIGLKILIEHLAG